MGAKTTEEKREEREEKRRATRVAAVFGEIDAATKKGRMVPTREISKVTGFSEALVMSTINLVNRTTTEYGNTATKMLTFTPPAKDKKHGTGGWSVANTWAERADWHATLHRHATTRVESLERFADVMEGLWPREAAAPGRLSAFYQTARQALDNATKVMTPRSAPKKVPKMAKRGISYVK